MCVCVCEFVLSRCRYLGEEAAECIVASSGRSVLLLQVGFGNLLQSRSGNEREEKRKKKKKKRKEKKRKEKKRKKGKGIIELEYIYLDVARVREDKEGALGDNRLKSRERQRLHQVGALLLVPIITKQKIIK